MMIVKDMFEQDILDVCWTPDGNSVIACSMDGAVGICTFDPAELGSPVAEVEQQAALRALYGDTMNATPSTMIIESTAMLALEKQRAATAAAAAPPPRNPAAPQSLPAAAAAAANEMEEPNAQEVLALQREVRQKDGRRRIMPVAIDQPPTALTTSLVPPAAALGGASSAFASAAVPAATCLPAAMPTANGAATAQSPRPMPAPCAGAVTLSSPSGAGSKRPAGAASSSAPMLPPAGGAPKRSRIVPTKVGNAASVGAAQSEHSQGMAARPSSGAAMLVALPPAPVPSGTIAFELPEAVLPDGGSSDSAGSVAPGSSTAGFGSAFGGGQPRTLEATPTGGGRSAPPSASAALGAACLLTCSWQGEVLWTAALPHAVTLLAGNSAFAAATCSDGSLYLFTPAGRRACPPLLPCAGGVAALAADLSHSLLVVGAHGEVLVFSNIPHQPRCALRCTATPLLHRMPALAGDGDGADAARIAPRLLDATLLTGRRPLLLLPHGAYTYSEALQSWLAMGDEAFTLSEHRSALPPPLPAASMPPSLPFANARRYQQPSRGPPSLSALQANHGVASGRFGINPARLAASMAAAPAEHQRLVSMGHVEHQLEAARTLGNPDEYSHWLRAYAGLLAQHVAVRPIRELCDDLIGPLSEPTGAADAAPVAAAEAGDVDAPSRWAPRVLGLCKRTLLRDVVLPALSNNRALQRILAEYVEQLAAVA